MRYYISQDETMRSQALRIINQISLEDSVVNVVDYTDPVSGKAMRLRLKESGVGEVEDLETGEVRVIKPDKDGKLHTSKKS